MINSRDINELHPKVAALCRAFVSACKDAGVDVIITSTYRDFESQAALYAQGRTKPGPRVTNAKPGQSYHNFRVAFDFVPVEAGKAQWTNLALFDKCGAIGESLGLEWGGNWTGGFRDMPHLQFTGGLSLAQLNAGVQLT